MCDPVSIATAALAVGSAVVEHIGTNQAFHANQLAANFNYAHESNTLEQKRVQLDQEKSETAFDTAITAAQAQGAVAASAAEQGLGAPSIAQSLHAEMFGIGRQQGIADLNDTNARAQLANEKQGAELSRQSQINSRSRSGLVNLGLGVGQGVLKGVSMHEKRGQ